MKIEENPHPLTPSLHMNGEGNNRKPDPDIYRISLDVAQVAPQEVIYVEVAESLNIVGLRHIDLKTTKAPHPAKARMLTTGQVC